MSERVCEWRGVFSLLPSFLPSLMPSNRRRLSGPHSIPLHCSLERAAAARLLKMASHLLILSAESELLSMMSEGNPVERLG